MRPPLDPTARNERMTATTATVLLVLLAVEGFTLFSVRQMLSVHIVVGLLLIPPIVLKLLSTGYRFFRYYTGNAAFVAKGPPQIVMRLLAPLLILSTVVLFGTGVALLLLGPEHGRDLVLGLHKASFLVWFGVTSIHVLVYARRLPAALRGGRLWARVGLVTGSLVVGAVLAGSAYSLAGPWLHSAHEDNGRESAPLAR